MAAALRIQAPILQKLRPVLNVRQISTSKKNQETLTLADIEKQGPPTSKNWVTYGFDRKNEAEDRKALHLTFFGAITICIVGSTFLFMYTPDVNLKHWSQREAFIELRRREEAGLPLIDANLIDPAKVTLPTDEELGDTEIII